MAHTARHGDFLAARPEARRESLGWLRKAAKTLLWAREAQALSHIERHAGSLMSAEELAELKRAHMARRPS